MKTKLWLVGLVLLVFGAAPASAWAGSIGGAVSFDSGAPVAEVTVCVVGPVEACGEPTTSSWEVAGLPAGEYAVSFRAEDSNLIEQFWHDAAYAQSATLVAIGESAGTEDVQGIDAKMHLGAELKGQVTDAGGQPLPGAFACIAELGGIGRSFCAETDAGGFWAYHGLVPGGYKLHFTGPNSGPAYATAYYDGKESEGTADEIDLEPGDTFTAGTSLELAGTVEGTVTGEGEALGSASVCGYSATGHQVGCEVVGPLGEYAFTGLAPGAYRFEYEASGFRTEFSGHAESLATATPVQVAAGQTIQVPFDLKRPSSLRGRVTDHVTGQPIKGVEVCAVISASISGGCDETGADGRYEFAVEPGTYSLLFEGLWVRRQFHGGVASEGEATPVTVGATAVTVDEEMTATGDIYGQAVRGGGGSNVVGAQVCALPAGGGAERCTTSSAPGGNFRIGELVPGQYKLRLSKTGFFTQYYDGKDAEGEAAALTVVAAQQTGPLAAHMEVKEAPAVVTVPEVSGTGKVGQALSCTAGTWTGSPATFTYEYFWYRETTEIAGAHASTYTLVAGDVGHEIQCGVKATNKAGSTGPVKSSTALNVPASRAIVVTVVGSGSVSAANGSISGCTTSGGSACEGEYEAGTEVTLTATPGPHQRLMAWVGCTSETGNQCTVKVEGLEQVAVQFVPILKALEVTKSGAGSGTVEATNGSIDCGPSCGIELEEGTTVTLNATPAAGSVFTGWSGAGCAGTGSCVVTLNGDAEVTASFALKPLDDGGSNVPANPPATGGTITPPVTTPPPPAVPPLKKPLQCKKGFKKVTKGGKARCVKKPTPRHKAKQRKTQ